jgi:predicted Zn-ribbon and HTH transcriptional regulator
MSSTELQGTDLETRIIRTIFKTFDEEVFVLLNNVHKKYPETSIVEMENVWRDQGFTLPYDELKMIKIMQQEQDDELKINNKQCQHIPYYQRD